MKRRGEPAPVALDDTPLGQAWARTIEDRAKRGHPSATAIVAMVERLPAEVKSGPMPPPAWWPGKVCLPLRTIAPAVDRDSSEAEVADNFVSHMCLHRLAVPPSPEQRERELLIASAERKVAALRRDLQRLGVTQQELFWVLRSSPHESEFTNTLRSIFRGTPNEVWSMTLSDHPGSALCVLDAFIPAARAPLFESAAQVRLWNPDDPPCEPATATLDAFACVLSVFFAGATLTLAARCAIACHPERARGIYRRAARYRSVHGDALQPRQGIEWREGAFSPLPPAKDTRRRVTTKRKRGQ